MTLQPRHRRWLAWVIVGQILVLAYEYWPSSTSIVVAAGDSVQLAEKRLAKLRETAATVPAKEDILKKVSAELGTREKGLIAGDTVAQAQAQLIQLIRRLGNNEAPPIVISGTELPAVKPLGDAYGEASVAVRFECRVDQLVNLLAALAVQPELVASSDLGILTTNTKEKTISARLTVSGIVARKLVPEKKGGTAF